MRHVVGWMAVSDLQGVVLGLLGSLCFCGLRGRQYLHPHAQPLDGSPSLLLHYCLLALVCYLCCAWVCARAARYGRPDILSWPGCPVLV